MPRKRIAIDNAKRTGNHDQGTNSGRDTSDMNVSVVAQSSSNNGDTKSSEDTTN